MKPPMTHTDAAGGTAEALLQKLQAVLGDAAGADPSRAALRSVEREHGAQATRWGRLLNDLVAGSHAWDLWEARQAHPAPLPRLHELCVCEPVLQLMRESGELAEREHLLRERDAALAMAWGRPAATDEEWWLEAEAVQDGYFAAVQRATAAYQAHYEALRRAASGLPAPLAAPRIRSRLLLQPPLMSLLFGACHQERASEEGEAAGCRQGGNALMWTGSDSRLDAMTWDVAALAVSAFYVRTDGSRFDAGFPVLVEDYFAWRGTDPRKRSREGRAQIAARLELLCSDRMQVRSEAELWLTDPQTGRRRKTRVMAEGPFLIKRSRFFRPSPTPNEAAPETTGYLLSLGEWARPFVEERAMLGIHLKRLAEYDLQRQGWERRIGWYLVFQMNNQASKMTFQDVTKDGRTRTLVTPQHPLKMRTVLNGSHVAWEETARTNPGKLIKQWGDALETLRRDGILGPCPCLDGAADGSDLPARGRLAALLERRFQFVPGRDLLPHLRAKRGAAERKRAV
jgi:hypothetical protein